MGYVDITEEYKVKKEYQLKNQKYFIDQNGIKHNVDGKHVIFKPTKREIEVAKILGEIIGGNVNIIPRVNKPLGMKTPDYIINGEKYDLKEITGNGKYVIEGNLRNKKKQSNNFIIDLTCAKISLEEAKSQIKKIYQSKRYLWVDKIFIVIGNNTKSIYKRN